MTADPAPRYAEVSCSQCGHTFGPGNNGFSHCDQHPGHVRNMTLFARRLQDATDLLGSVAHNINPRWDDPRQKAKELRARIAVVRGIIAEMDPPRRAKHV